MPSILIDLYFLQGLAAHVDQLVTEVQQNAPSPSFVFNVLEAGWQGQSRQSFDRAYEDFRRFNDQIASVAQALSQHLRQEIFILEQIERSNSVNYAP